MNENGTFYGSEYKIKNISFHGTEIIMVKVY